MSEFRIPVATYRLQLNSQFRFAEAQALVPYLEQLGISDIYISPVFKARKGSLHGYDVVDPTQINPELGSEAEFEALLQGIMGHNMGLLLDIVPNHMAISSENPFWMDLLENGTNSRYALFFDIDWKSYNSNGGKKVLLPVLGKPFGQALEDQEISLVLENSDIFIRYYDIELPLSLKSLVPIFSYHLADLESRKEIDRSDLKQFKQVLENIEKLPAVTGVSPAKVSESDLLILKQRLQELIIRSQGIRNFIKENLQIFNGEKGNPRSFDQLDEILDQQVYRLSYWRSGRQEINYRRFFDINTLIGIREEVPEVMETTHALVHRLLREGKITGLRIDHIDGLYDPLAYLNRLRQRTGRFYIVVEKILSGDEILPGSWPVYGTTGYDFAREVNAVFVDNEGIRKLDTHYKWMIERNISFADVVYEKKKQVLESLFSVEVRSLGHRLAHLARQDRYAHDLIEEDLERYLVELTACLPVYRTYINSYAVSPTDKRYLQMAFQEVIRRSPDPGNFTSEFLKRVLFLEFPDEFTSEQKQLWLHWVMKWQQLTGSVAAKGLEDTALYNYNPLVSLNVIGTSITPQESSIEKFHRFNLSRQGHWPVTLNASSTHDTKQSEDVRARIDVLSERPRLWTAYLSLWRNLNYVRQPKIDGHPIPDPNTEELLYQTLVGAWPFSQDTLFKERFKGYMLKAIREAKVYTSWLSFNEQYENAVLTFIDAILEESEQNEFVKSFLPFQREISFYGALNSLSQVLLKITSPGVPDFYQGTELWELSLVDPDNRRPVDFNLRQGILSALKEQEKQNPLTLLEDILNNWVDGRVKLYLTAKSLSLRQKYSDLFRSGEYLPLQVEGKRQNNVIAFARHRENEWAVVAVPCFFTKLVSMLNFPLGKRVWKDGSLILPETAPSQWQNALTGETVNTTSENHRLLLSEVFNKFPVALLTGISAQS